MREALDDDEMVEKVLKDYTAEVTKSRIEAQLAQEEQEKKEAEAAEGGADGVPAKKKKAKPLTSE